VKMESKEGSRQRKLPSRNIIAILIAAIIIISSIVIITTMSNNSKEKIGPGITLSILPYSSSQSNVTFLHASLQIYMNNPPSTSQGIQSYKNVSTLYNGTVNSTGNLTTNLSYSFYSLAEKWTLYFMATNNLGSSTSLTAQVSYFYNVSGSIKVYYDTMIIPFDPAFFIQPTGNLRAITSIWNYHHLTSIAFTLHPSIKLMTQYSYPNSSYTNSMTPSVLSQEPEGVIGGGGGNNSSILWVLTYQHTFSGYDIPLAWANNSILLNNNEEIDLGVTLGSTQQQAYFHPAGVSNYSGKVSYSILNNSSYSSGYVNGQWTAGQILYNALPLNENLPHSIMLYVVGTITIDEYREWYNSSGGWQKTDNNQTITEISSLDVNSGGLFEMGYMGLTPGSTWSLMEPENLAKYLISSSYLGHGTYNMTNNQSAEWASIEDTVSSTATNLWPEINSAFGLALSVIGVIAAASGWTPGSGWLDLATDVVAYAGLESSVYGLMMGQVTGVQNSFYLFIGSATLENPVGSPNNLEFKMMTDDVSMSINGGSGQFNMPVYDLVAVST